MRLPLPFWPFSECGIFVILDLLGPFRRAIISLFSTILAIFGCWIFSHFEPFLPFWEGSLFIFLFGHLVRFCTAVILLYSSILAIVRTAVLLMFLGILAVSRPQCFSHFIFWPFSNGGSFFGGGGALWPFSEGSIFILFWQFGHFCGAVCSLFSAILAFFGGQYVHYLRPFSDGGILIILGRFGRIRTAGFLIFLGILAIFGGQHFYCFWPLENGQNDGKFSKGGLSQTAVVGENNENTAVQKLSK